MSNSQMNILKDNEYKQSRKMLMAKSAEPEQLQDGIDATPACHVLSVFGVFLSNQSIARILQATLQLHQSRYFQQQACAGWSPFLVALSTLWVALKRTPAQMPSSEWKRILMGWSCNFNTDILETFLNLAVHYALDFAPEWICQHCTLWAWNVKCSSMSSMRY